MIPAGPTGSLVRDTMDYLIQHQVRFGRPHVAFALAPAYNDHAAVRLACRGRG